MARNEFTKKTKRAAWDRAAGHCEGSGELVGLPPGAQCGADLARGVEYDHVILDANSKDNSLENCWALCPGCHRHKTNTHDKKTAAKTVRQQDAHRSIKGPKRGRSFRKMPPGYRWDWSKGRAVRA